MNIPISITRVGTYSPLVNSKGQANVMKMIEEFASENVIKLYKEHKQLMIKPKDKPDHINDTNLELEFHQENGDYYIGQWNNDANDGEKREGQGVCVSASGDLYEGFWDMGQKNGFGRLIKGDGSIYQGKFKNDQPYGAGITIITDFHDLAKSKAKYNHKGFYRKGLPQGTGVQIWEDGTKYKGYFEKGQLASENATLIYESGMTYKGDMANSQFHGNGELNDPGKMRYIGKFKNGKFDDDNGKLFILDQGKTEEIYIGSFKNGKRHGEGELLIPGQPKEFVVYENDKFKSKSKKNKK